MHNFVGFIVVLASPILALTQANNLTQTASTQNVRIGDAANVASSPLVESEQKNSSHIPEPLNLTCFGGGTANRNHTSSIFAHNSSGQSAWATETSTHEARFEDQVDVRLFSGDDRIRLPRKMLSLMHGGNDGWFKIRNLKISDRDILGNAGINFINNPKIRIDRVTGIINISGRAGDYLGECKKNNPELDKPKF